MHTESAQENDDTRPGMTGMARKVAVGSVGGAVTAAGIVMLVTPGPGIVVSLAGLAILAREFPGAATQLNKIKHAVSRRATPDE